MGSVRVQNRVVTSHSWCLLSAFMYSRIGQEGTNNDNKKFVRIKQSNWSSAKDTVWSHISMLDLWWTKWDYDKFPPHVSFLRNPLHHWHYTSQLLTTSLNNSSQTAACSAKCDIRAVRFHGLALSCLCVKSCLVQSTYDLWCSRWKVCVSAKWQVKWALLYIRTEAKITYSLSVCAVPLREICFLVWEIFLWIRR
jgi:hypothetical protein